MGLIAERLAEEIRGAGDDPGWLTRDDDVDGYSPRTSAGVRVSQRVALGLTTVWRCVDLLSSAVSQAPKDVIVKVRGRSFEEFTKPGWLIQPDPTDPTYTINDYFAQVSLSLLLEGNYFVHVYPDVFNPLVLTVLPPAIVDVKKGPVYELKDPTTGSVSRVLSPMEVLHGTWIRPAGALRGISPLESLRRAVGNAVGAEDHAGRFFGQGAALSFGVEVPGSLTPDQKKDMADNLRARYAGNANSHAIGVLTGGAKFIAGLAPTPEQAQMLATRQFSVEDLCRPYGVPPAMAGSTEPGAASFASTESYDSWFKERAVLPLAGRIESQHNRLVQVPETVSDPSAEAQFKFNLDHIARVSIEKRYAAYKEGVQGGFLEPAEARSKEDLPPVDGADRLFMQAQMVPIGSLGALPPVSVVRSVEAVRDVRDDHEEGAFSGMAAMLRALAQPPVVNVAPPEVRVESPSVSVTVPEFPTPVVNVTVPDREFPTPQVNVTVPQQAAPIVSVSVPSEMAMHIKSMPKTRRTLKRDSRTGQVLEVVDG